MAAAALAVGARPDAHRHALVRTFDRTVVCSVADEGGVRQFHVSGAPAPQPEAGVSGDRQSVSAIAVTSGLGLDARLVGDDADRGVYVRKKRCRTTSANVPLTSKGLAGPPIRWASGVICPGGGPILVRLRAKLGANPNVQPGYAMRGRVISASLAVRLYKNRKPIAFAALTDHANELRLYYSPSCSKE